MWGFFAQRHKKHAEIKHIASYFFQAAELPWEFTGAMKGIVRELMIGAGFKA